MNNNNEYKKKEAELIRLNRALRMIAACKQLVIKIQDEKELLKKICQIFIKRGGYRMAWIGYAKNNPEKSVTPVACAGFENGYLKTINITWADTERGRGPTGTAIRTGKTRFIADFKAAGNFSPWLKDALKRGYASSISLAIKDNVNKKIYGALSIYSDKIKAFNKEEIVLLEELLSDVAAGITIIRLNNQKKKALKKLAISKNKINRQKELINSVNEILKMLLRDGSEEILAQKCLDEAEKLTGSKIGYIGELNKDESINILAISNSGWKNCRMPLNEARKAWRGMMLRGIRSSVIKNKKTIIINNISPSPEFGPKPKGHPVIKNMCAAPLKDEKNTIGAVILANKEKGFTPEDTEIMEVLGAAVVQVLKHRRMEEYSKQILRSNKDLEQFANMVSHDLRAPMVNINNYAQLLARRYKEKLDAGANDFINYITGGIIQMSQLIDDLLSYSKLSTKSEPFKTVDCANVIEETLETLKPAIEKNKAVITYVKMPKIQADKTQMRQLFQNLLDNAVKFRGNKPPKVHISARKQKNKWLFSVKDNGIGIDPKYKDYIFKMFARLKEDDAKKEGTGVGLAICKKIVERHNGEIWIESKPDKGSTFYFTIPMA